MDIESVNVIEPYGRFFFFFLRFFFSFQTSSQYTNVNDGTHIAHEYESEQKQFKKNIRLIRN